MVEASAENLLSTVPARSCASGNLPARGGTGGGVTVSRQNVVGAGGVIPADSGDQSPRNTEPALVMP